MAVFRFLASLFLLVAVIALVADATPTTDEPAGFSATSIAEQWEDVSPSSLESAKRGISNATYPWVWDNLIFPILSIPTFVFFGLLALASGYAGRRRNRVNIYIN
jgi:hypothetical protein